ncbi:MAG: hypothetical protein ACYDC5_10785 [Candidatus Dormibacteria bacterium]
MHLRWAAAGMLAAEAQFRPVKGDRQLTQLAAILARVTADGEAQMQASARARCQHKCCETWSRWVMPRAPRIRHLDDGVWIVYSDCGLGAFTSPAVGRPHLTCPNACRQAAHRERQKLLRDEGSRVPRDVADKR